jgi:DNA-binding NtrC family response regulator
MNGPKYKILLVDDEELIRELVYTILSNLNHACITAKNGVDALDKMKRERFDAVITDIKMPEMDGIILTREIARQYPGTPVMVMTGFEEEYTAGTAISEGAKEFIKKPFSIEEFSLRLQKMIGDASESQRQWKVEKEKEEDVQDLMNELETALKKSEEATKDKLR